MKATSADLEIFVWKQNNSKKGKQIYWLAETENTQIAKNEIQNLERKRKIQKDRKSEIELRYKKLKKDCETEKRTGRKIYRQTEGESI